MLAVTVYERDGGSYVDFSGVADPKVIGAVNFAVDRIVNGAAIAPPSPASPPPYEAYPPATPPAAQYAAPPPGYAPAPPGGAEPAGDKACPECAETVRAAARSCRFCGYRFDANVSPE